MAITLRELLDRKSTPIIYVKASMPALQAIEIMCDKQVGSLLIESDEDAMLGIATERDILRFCAGHGGNIGSASIGEVMTRELAVATPEWTVEQAMSVMTEQRFRHLPVVEGGYRSV